MNSLSREFHLKQQRKDLRKKEKYMKRYSMFVINYNQLQASGSCFLFYAFRVHLSDLAFQ